MKHGYCRVSTRGQLTGNSIEEQKQAILSQYPEAQLTMESFSGAKERPLFNSLLDKLESGDTLIVTKLDRFCRTTKEGLQHIDKLMNRGVRIHMLNMGLIEDTPMGRLIVTNLLAFAEFERSMIIERTQSGKTLAKMKEGYREGRPRKFADSKIHHALALLDSHTYGAVEDLTGISKSTLIRAKRKLATI